MWKQTYESTQMRAQRRAHIWEHRGGKLIPKPGSSLCASVRSRNAHGHVTRAILRGILPEKCRTRSPQEAFCMEIYRKDTEPEARHRHFMTKFSGKCRTQIPRPTLCASLRCRNEIHMEISREPFCMVIYRKIIGHGFRVRREHLHRTPGPNWHRKNLLVWPHRVGKNGFSHLFQKCLKAFCQPALSQLEGNWNQIAFKDINRHVLLLDAAKDSNLDRIDPN